MEKKEYIDREAFKRKLIDEKCVYPAGVDHALYEMPAADVAPVVHGEWERELDVHDEPFYQCSVCGECFDSNRDSTHEVFKYCPDCGARMDGERREG